MPVHLRCVLGRVILILKSGNPGHVRQECRRSGPGSRVERRRMHDIVVVEPRSAPEVVR